MGRVSYVSATDGEALEAFQLCCRLEGIIPALEPSHALAQVIKLAPTKPKDHLMVMNMCGRGDKDIFTVAAHLGVKLAHPSSTAVSPFSGSDTALLSSPSSRRAIPITRLRLRSSRACPGPAPTSSSSECLSQIRWRTPRLFRRQDCALSGTARPWTGR